MNFQTNQLFPPDLQMFRSIHAWSALLRVVVEIQRKAESVTLNRSQRQGVKAREIYQRYPKAKADGLIKSLRSRGLWYWDPDFGDDEEDHLLLLLFMDFRVVRAVFRWISRSRSNTVDENRKDQLT